MKGKKVPSFEVPARIFKKHNATRPLTEEQRATERATQRKTSGTLISTAYRANQGVAGRRGEGFPAGKLGRDHGEGPVMRSISHLSVT